MWGYYLTVTSFGILLVLGLLSLVVLAIVGLSVWARFNPSSDPKDREWSDAIR